MALPDDRRWLALAFIVLLGVVTVAALALVAARRWLGIESAEVKEILVIIFPTLSTLAAGAAGFYFRGRS
jgi:hypothetical protein